MHRKGRRIAIKKNISFCFKKATKPDLYDKVSIKQTPSQSTVNERIALHSLNKGTFSTLLSR